MWRLCNGLRGTPDLRDKFIPGAGSLYTPGQLGGSSQHDHAFTSDGHPHVMTVGGNTQSGANFSLITSSSLINGTTNVEALVPPFHSLAYIMYAGKAL